MKDVPLRQFCTVLEHVRAKPINEEEAVFSFGFKGQTRHFLLVKNTDIDPRVKRAYHGIDTSGFKNSLAVVFGGWERPMVFFFSKILVLILFLFCFVFQLTTFSLKTCFFSVEWFCQN